MLPCRADRSGHPIHSGQDHRRGCLLDSPAQGKFYAQHFSLRGHIPLLVPISKLSDILIVYRTTGFATQNLGG